jgi:hypothetical protein
VGLVFGHLRSSIYNHAQSILIWRYLLYYSFSSTISLVFTPTRLNEQLRIRSRTARRDQDSALIRSHHTKPTSTFIEQHGRYSTLHNLSRPRHGLRQTGRQHLCQTQAPLPISSHNFPLDSHDEQRRSRACMELINRHERAGGANQEPVGRG